MTYLFGRVNQGVLERFACSNVLLAFDYDGTLAPIVSVPSRAVMRVATRRWLKAVSTLYPCVVISGRARADARARLQGVAIHQVIGNHGAESQAESQDVQQHVKRWMPALKSRLEQQQGIVLEDKKLSVAVHYRHARRKHHARAAILRAARSVDHVRTIGGKFVVNLLVPDAPNKGLALERERSHLKSGAVIYVGDDETDEDVFRLSVPQLLSIRVGRSRTSSAAHYVRDQKEVDRLLARLVELRQGRMR